MPRYRLAMPPSYLRHPHLNGDTLVLVAEDDLWTAPVDGGRAYRLTADGVPVARPRISPDGALVAWTSTRERAPEVFVTEVEGGAARRLTWWGDHTTKLIGWTPEGEVLAVSAAGQPSRRHPWAHVIPATGGTPRRLPLGPLADLAQRSEGPAVLLSATMTREMAWQKRYRGGTAGKLWWNPEGAFVRLAADLDGNLDAPMLVGDRIAFLSDHEGWGNLYSLDGRGADLRRHTDHGGRRRARVLRPARRHRRHPRGLRVGRAALAARRPRRRTPAPRRPARRPPHRPRALPHHDGRVAGPRAPGHHRPVQRRRRPGHRAPAHPPRRARPRAAGHPRRAGPARRAAGRGPRGVGRRRARRGRRVHRPARPARPRRAGTMQRFGEFGRVLELVPAPDGKSVALTTHDGRLLLLAEGEFRELARGGDGEIYDVAFSPDSAWLAYCDPVGLGPLAGRPRAAGRRRGGAGHRGPLPRRRPGVHRSTASTSRSSRCAASTRSTTSTPSTSRSPPPGGRSSCRSARARRRRSGRARTGARSRPRTTSRRTRPRSTRPTPATRPRKRPARRRRRRTKAPPEVVVDIEGLAARRGADPGRRGPLPRHDARPRTACSGTASRSTARSATAARAPT